MPTLEASLPDRIQIGQTFSKAVGDRTQFAFALDLSRPDRFCSDSFLEVSFPDRFKVSRLLQVDRADSIQFASFVGSGGYAEPVNGVYTLGPNVKLFVDGADTPFESLQLSTAVNAGWSGSVTLPYWMDVGFADDAEIRVVIDDGLGNVLHSPPLVSHDRDTDDNNGIDGGSTTLTLIDRCTYRAGKDNESFPTFTNTTSAAILQALATAADIQITGVPNFPTTNEDAKQTKLNDAIQRFTAVAAKEWHIDTQGTMVLTDWGTSGGALSYDWSTCKRKVSVLQRFTQMNIGKRSAVQSSTTQGEFTFPFDDIGFKTIALPNPLRNVYLEDRSKSGAGYIDAIALWQGDPAKAGKLIDYRAIPGGGFNNISLFLQGTWPATHITLYVMPPGGINAFFQAFAPGEIQATLFVKGVPPTAVPPGVDDSFFYPYDSGGFPSRRAPDWVDSLFPNRQWAVDRAPAYLAIKNKVADTITLNGRLAADVWLYQGFEKYGKSWHVDAISWSCPMGQTSAPETSITLVPNN